MKKAPYEYASKLEEAVMRRDWGRVKKICEMCPMSIVAASGGSSPIFEAAVLTNRISFLRYLCHVLYIENGIHVDDVTQTPGLMRPTYCLYVSDSILYQHSARILLEYGGSPPSDKDNKTFIGGEEINAIVAQHRTEIAAKWERCRNASATILLLRRNIIIFRIIGHDMTRLIAQEVWTTKRHEKWETV